MKYKSLLYNIIASLVERGIILGFQFLASIIIIRNLAREEFGILGIVVGVFTFFHIVNISLETIILKKHLEYKDQIDSYLEKFYAFNCVKCIFFFVVTLITSFIFATIYNNTLFYYGFFSFYIINCLDSLLGPLTIYLSASLRHALVTKMTFFRFSLNFVFLAGLFYYPSVKYLLIKDIILAVLVLLVWKYLCIKKIKVKYFWPNFISGLDIKLIKDALFSFSLWAHLNSVVTNFIYKADTLILSFFSNLRVVGDYNVALNSANVANVIPAVLSAQNSVALSNSNEKEKTEKILQIFMRLSLYVSISILITLILLGKYYLRLVTGEQNVEMMYHYMILIGVGLLIIKGVASPIVSYINMKGEIRRLFYGVNLPVFFISMITYLISGYLWSSIGLAYANIFNAVLWITILTIEAKRYNVKFFKFVGPIEDIKTMINILKENR